LHRLKPLFGVFLAPPPSSIHYTGSCLPRSSGWWRAPAMRSSEKRRNKSKNPREEIKVTKKAVSDREGEYAAYHAHRF